MSLYFSGGECTACEEQMQYLTWKELRRPAFAIKKN